MFKQASYPEAEYPPMRFFNLSTEEEYHEIYAAYEHLAHKRKWPMESAYDKLLTRLMGEHAAALDAATARATKAESRAEGLQAELAEQEREKLALILAAQPLPFPANEPAASYEQYFCQAGDDVCLLMWLSQWDAFEEVGTETGTWAEWDGDAYIPTQHAVSAFWPHPKAAPTPPPSSPAAAGSGEAVVADPVLAALQLLSDRFYDGGAMGSFEAINDAAHQAGYCLASDSATECDWSWCRHCDWTCPPDRAAPATTTGEGKEEASRG